MHVENSNVKAASTAPYRIDPVWENFQPGRWRHTDLWSRYDLHVVGQHGVAYCVKWEPCKFYFRRLTRLSSSILTVQHCASMSINLSQKRYQNLTACPTSWRQNSQHRYETKQSRHCLHVCVPLGSLYYMLWRLGECSHLLLWCW